MSYQAQAIVKNITQLECIWQQNQKRNSGHIVQLWCEKAQINIGAVTLPNL
jgi:hypothetical protein